MTSEANVLHSLTNMLLLFLFAVDGTWCTKSFQTKINRKCFIINDLAPDAYLYLISDGKEGSLARDRTMMELKKRICNNLLIEKIELCSLYEAKMFQPRRCFAERQQLVDRAHEVFQNYQNGCDILQGAWTTWQQNMTGECNQFCVLSVHYIRNCTPPETVDTEGKDLFCTGRNMKVKLQPCTGESCEKRQTTALMFLTIIAIAVFLSVSFCGIICLLRRYRKDEDSGFVKPDSANHSYDYPSFSLRELTKDS